MLLRKKLLLCYSLFILIAPIGPSLYTLFVEFVGLTIGLAALYLLYTYYKSGPPSRHTSLNSSMRMLMITESLLMSHFFFVSIMLNVFPEGTRILYHSNQTLVCSILSSRYIYFSVL